MKMFEHGGNIYCIKNPAISWLDFSANINPLGLSETVEKSIRDNIGGLVHYPDPSGRELKQAISQYYGVSDNSLVLGNGAAELMYVFFHSIETRNVLIPVPSFSEYERAAISGGARITYHYLRPENRFQLLKKEILAKLKETDCFIIGNPNNPAGNLVKRDDVRSFCEAGKAAGTFIVVDESFMDFVPGREEYTALGLEEEFDNLIILQSMTKFYAIPGLRLGFAVMDEKLARRLEMAKDPWNVNLLAQCAGTAALGDRVYQSRTRETVAANKEALYNSLKKIPGLKVFPPTVNFVMMDIRNTGLTAAALSLKLRESGILIRDCSNYPGLDEYYVRVAVRLNEEIEILVKGIQEALQ